MKAVLIGSDFLLDNDGNAKLVEFNTSGSLPKYDTSLRFY